MQGMTGDLDAAHAQDSAPASTGPSRTSATEFHRARPETGEDGETELAVYPSRSSAVLSSVAWADGLIEIPPGQVIQRGDQVDFIPFANLFH